MRVFRLLKAIYRWCMGGFRISPLARKRMKICKACDFLSSGKCDICGCVVKYKTKMDTEECPIHKW